MKHFSIIILTLLCVSAYADSYWIELTDKRGTTSEPALSERALEMRTLANIDIDSLDLPVSQSYIETISNLGGQIEFCSRWLNGITVSIESDAVLSEIQKQSFVKQIVRTRNKQSVPQYYSTKRKPLKAETRKQANSQTTDTQISMLNLAPLHAKGYRGNGIHIAVIDDGFYGVDEYAAFADMRSRILSTADFVTPESPDPYCHNNMGYGDHGTAVLGCIAATTTDYQGTAPDASFHLIRTEDDTYENMREADALVAALEYADSVGCQLASISLGYLDAFDNAEDTHISYSELDGKTLRPSRAATIAARKGMLVCVAMGNEGTDSWHWLDTPADADSIISVGAVSSSYSASSFTSYGPTADNRQKPELSALGSSAAVINAMTGRVTYSSGTSFATPILAGAVASLWSALPELNNMQIRERLIASASQHQTPDYRIGYGVPDIWKAYNQTDTDTFENAISEIVLQQECVIYDLIGNRYANTDNLQAGIYIIITAESAQKIYIKKR